MENTYLMTRLLDQDTHLNIFNNHIMRSKWNYQFTKEFSLRLIGQYETTISNPGLTTLQNTKSFNGDVLFTYMLNPGHGDLRRLQQRSAEPRSALQFAGRTACCARATTSSMTAGRYLSSCRICSGISAHRCRASFRRMKTLHAATPESRLEPEILWSCDGHTSV